MSDLVQIIRRFRMECLQAGHDAPVSIGITEDTAKKLRTELRMMIRYTNTLETNVPTLYGIELHAPKGFDWTVETKGAERDRP